jgi:hypothetical protein
MPQRKAVPATVPEAEAATSEPETKAGDQKHRWAFATPVVSWWTSQKRPRKFLLIGLVIAVLLIALIIGLAVGLTVGKK